MEKDDDDSMDAAVAAANETTTKKKKKKRKEEEEKWVTSLFLSESLRLEKVHIVRGSQIAMRSRRTTLIYLLTTR